MLSSMRRLPSSLAEDSEGRPIIDPDEEQAFVNKDAYGTFGLKGSVHLRQGGLPCRTRGAGATEGNH